MDGMKIESVSPELAPLITKTAHPVAEAPVKKEPAPAAVPPPPAQSEDRVDVKSAEEASREIRDPNPRAGKTYDYTVDSMHDVVIKVKDMETRREVKQIPDKAYQAFKRGYHKVVDHLFDKKV